MAYAKEFRVFKTVYCSLTKPQRFEGQLSAVREVWDKTSVTARRQRTQTSREPTKDLA
jgi:hypothetical protein